MTIKKHRQLNSYHLNTIYDLIKNIYSPCWNDLICKGTWEPLYDKLCVNIGLLVKNEIVKQFIYD